MKNILLTFMGIAALAVPAVCEGTGLDDSFNAATGVVQEFKEQAVEKGPGDRFLELFQKDARKEVANVQFMRWYKTQMDHIKKYGASAVTDLSPLERKALTRQVETDLKEINSKGYYKNLHDCIQKSRDSLVREGVSKDRADKLALDLEMGVTISSIQTVADYQRALELLKAY